jgi:hypothetical protein
VTSLFVLNLRFCDKPFCLNTWRGGASYNIEVYLMAHETEQGTVVFVVYARPHTFVNVNVSRVYKVWTRFEHTLMTPF